MLDILARAASVIAEGEVMQLAAANDADTTRERYMEIVAAKTAALFAAAAQRRRGGGWPAWRGSEPRSKTYGRELGLAFQLVDDALDYGGLAAAMGKNAGDDFREGKVTLPVVFARDAGDEAERAFWRRVMGGERSDEDFHRALALLKRHNAIALHARRRARARRAPRARRWRRCPPTPTAKRWPICRFRRRARLLRHLCSAMNASPRSARPARAR